MQAHLLLPEGIEDLLFPLLLLCSGGYRAPGGLFCYTGMEWNLVFGHHLPHQKVSHVFAELKATGANWIHHDRTPRHACSRGPRTCNHGPREQRYE